MKGNILHIFIYVYAFSRSIILCKTYPRAFGNMFTVAKGSIALKICQCIDSSLSLWLDNHLFCNDRTQNNKRHAGPVRPNQTIIGIMSAYRSIVKPCLHISIAVT